MESIFFFYYPHFLDLHIYFENKEKEDKEKPEEANPDTSLFYRGGTSVVPRPKH